MRAAPVLISALFLFLFAIAGSGLVAFTHERTADRIAENQRRALLRSLNELIPPERYDNDIFSDILHASASGYTGILSPVTVYRARSSGWPEAAVLELISPHGYSGNIRLLVAINLDGSVAGVRIVNHHETPGLGDKIELEKSDWILDFNGKSIGNPKLRNWKVKRYGGVFDQFTGATITPRAVVKAVRDALLYFNANKQSLFEKDPDQE